MAFPAASPLAVWLDTACWRMREHCRSNRKWWPKVESFSVSRSTERCRSTEIWKKIKNVPTRPLFRLFSVFSNKHHYNFYKKYMWKMSIQYTVLEFEPTTFGTWVSSHNHLTTAHAPKNILFTMSSGSVQCDQITPFCKIIIFDVSGRVQSDQIRQISTFWLKLHPKSNLIWLFLDWWAAMSHYSSSIPFGSCKNIQFY